MGDRNYELVLWSVEIMNCQPSLRKWLLKQSQGISHRTTCRKSTPGRWGTQASKTREHMACPQKERMSLQPEPSKQGVQRERRSEVMGEARSWKALGPA